MLQFAVVVCEENTTEILGWFNGIAEAKMFVQESLSCTKHDVIILDTFVIFRTYFQDKGYLPT